MKLSSSIIKKMNSQKEYDKSTHFFRQYGYIFSTTIMIRESTLDNKSLDFIKSVNFKLYEDEAKLNEVIKLQSTGQLVKYTLKSVKKITLFGGKFNYGVVYSPDDKTLNDIQVDKDLLPDSIPECLYQFVDSGSQSKLLFSDKEKFQFAVMPFEGIRGEDCDEFKDVVRGMIKRSSLFA